MNEKIIKVRDTVQQRVNPLLDATAARVTEILDNLRGKAPEKAAANGNGSVNGKVNGH